MKKLIPFFLSFFFILGMVSCGDDDDTPDLDKTKKITIEIEASDNAQIDHVAISYSEGKTDTFTNLSVKKWTKEITYKGIAAVAAGGSTTGNQSGTIQIRMIENGKVVKESSAEGTILTCSVSY